MKILIGYDGSECADAALDDLTHAGLPPDAEAQFLRCEVGFRRRHRRLTKSSNRLAKRSRRQNWNAIMQSFVLRQRKHLRWLHAHESRVQTNFPNWKVTGRFLVWLGCLGVGFERQINGSRI
jgi:hypothetical protein